MEIWNAIVNFIVASVLMGTTLMYGTLGEILTEKSGNLNLGVEGLIYMGGAAGLIAPYLYEQAAGEAASPVIGRHPGHPGRHSWRPPSAASSSPSSPSPSAPTRTSPAWR